MFDEQSGELSLVTIRFPDIRCGIYSMIGLGFLKTSMFGMVRKWRIAMSRSWRFNTTAGLSGLISLMTSIPAVIISILGSLTTMYDHRRMRRWDVVCFRPRGPVFNIRAWDTFHEELWAWRLRNEHVMGQ